MLRIDDARRVTAAGALSHSAFARIREVRREQGIVSPVAPVRMAPPSQLNVNY